jgi:adenylate kinase family enzyme
MKKLIIVNGTMGVGKTTVCRELYEKLDKSIWLDGDWCWMMNPFMVTEENKKMVENNIIYMLRSFLCNSSFDYVVFNWVIHQEFIFDILLDRLKDLEFRLYKISLVCSEEALRERILKDPSRDESKIDMSLERLQEYYKMDTIKIDTSDIRAVEAANRIADIVRG